MDQKLAEAFAVSVGTEVIVCSSIEENCCRDILPYISEGKTIAFIGSTGVGKSTLINRLMGEELLPTGEIRDDGKGRHTTTHRQLLLLPNGGIVIDTPGMRELQRDSGDLDKSFEDIVELAALCKFRDCSHTKEPGCAVQRAIIDGELSEERLRKYFKLQKEIDYDGLNFRQREEEKIKRMFGGLSGVKQAVRYAKNKNRYR